MLRGREPPPPAPYADDPTTRLEQAGVRGDTATVLATLDTGLPADSLTPPERRYTEYYIAGTEPGAIPVDVWRLFEWGPVGL